MKKWIAFLPEEVNALCANPKTPEDNNEIKCPNCSEFSVRNYYREINISRLIGTSWFWCRNCKKYIHFSGAPRSIKFEFNDPISEVPEKEGTAWYDYLDSLWEQGILPQVFKRKSK